MIYQEIPLKLEGSLPYAKLVLYIQDYSDALQIKKRPMVVLCPGGGYGHTSDREAETMALQFMAMGAHAAVLRYSVAPAKHPVQITELAYSMKYIREHANEWNVDADKIMVQGSSAGGHLAAMLGCFWNTEWLAQAVEAKENAEIKPNGMILSYPVITSGEYAHKGSFDNLVGENEELRKQLSLEYQVDADTPKTFIWHTFEDEAVPVENSLFMVSALRKYNIPTEFHLYPKGVHGLALANALTADIGGGHTQKECETWIHLARTWMENL